MLTPSTSFIIMMMKARSAVLSRMLWEGWKNIRIFSTLSTVRRRLAVGRVEKSTDLFHAFHGNVGCQLWEGWKSLRTFSTLSTINDPKEIQIGVEQMGKHLDPLQKEFLIRRFRSNPDVKVSEFCDANNVSVGAFKIWLKQYEAGGLEGLARADSTTPDVLPEGIDRTEENYKREILKLRIENERLKKNYCVERQENGEMRYIPLRPKNSGS